MDTQAIDKLIYSEMEVFNEEVKINLAVVDDFIEDEKEIPKIKNRNKTEKVRRKKDLKNKFQMNTGHRVSPLPDATGLPTSTHFPERVFHTRCAEDLERAKIKRKRRNTKSSNDYIRLNEISNNITCKDTNRDLYDKDTITVSSKNNYVAQPIKLVLLNLMMESEYPTSFYEKVFQSSEMRFWLKNISKKQKQLLLRMMAI